MRKKINATTIILSNAVGIPDNSIMVIEGDKKEYIRLEGGMEPVYSFKSKFHRLMYLLTGWFTNYWYPEVKEIKGKFTRLSQSHDNK